MKKILQRLFVGETIRIGRCDGLKTLYGSGTFRNKDSDFVNWGLDNPGSPTEETEAFIHEMVEDATFDQIFRSFGADLDKLCFTQHQIDEFCRKNRDRLRQEGFGTFFLTKKKLNILQRLLRFILKELFKWELQGKYFVVSVYVGGDGLVALVNHLEYDSTWYGGGRHRVVSPQLPSAA